MLDADCVNFFMSKSNLFLLGGIGNQLFQLNQAYKLSLLGNKVVVDTSWYKHSSDDPELGRYLLTSNGAELLQYFPFVDHVSTLPASLKFFLRCLHRVNRNSDIHIHLLGCRYSYGYFQDFSSVDDIFREFVISYLSSQQFSRFIPSSSFVSLHLRCGDRISEFDSRNASSLYMHAQRASNRLTNGRLLVLSDSSHVRSQFPSIGVSYPNYSFRNPLEASLCDLSLMMSSVQIYSNMDSTFSYWASVLSSKSRFTLSGFDSPVFSYC